MSPSGAGHRVEYLIATVSELLDAAAVSTLVPLLPEADRSGAGRFRHVRDREAYAGAHVLFRLMAARWLGTEPHSAAELEVQRRCRTCGGSHGKPEIDGVELSLSRSAETVMIAAAPAGCAIGADLEQIPAQLFPGFDAFALAPAERESVPGADVSGRIRLWVAKEAALKATGHGLVHDPHTFSIEPAGHLRVSHLPVSHLPVRHGTTSIERAAQLVAGPAQASAEATSTEADGAPEPRTAVVRCAETGELDRTNIAWLPAPKGYAAALATAGTPAVARLDLTDLLPALTRVG